jgi:hypothetical protein
MNLDPSSDGFGTSVDTNIATFANIPVCPNQWSSRDLFDQDYELEMVLKDWKGRAARRTFTVKPVCNESEPGLSAECRCICRHGYILGEKCL